MNPLTQFKKTLVLIILSLLSLVALALPRVARADAILDWNGHAANAIVSVAAMPGPRGLIRLAMVHVAIYDAVNYWELRPSVFVETSEKTQSNMKTKQTGNEIQICPWPGVK